MSLNPYPFNDNISVAVMYNLTGFSTLQKQLFNDFTVSKTHLTVHIMHFNRNHPQLSSFISSHNTLNSDFSKAILNATNTKLNNLKLHHDYNFAKMGDFHALLFQPNDKYHITNFRLELYKYINYVMIKQGKYIKGSRVISKLNKTGDGQNNYHVFYDNNSIPLYAVQDYYYGNGVWTPHISLAKSQIISNQINIYNCYIPNNIVISPKHLYVDIRKN